MANSTSNLDEKLLTSNLSDLNDLLNNCAVKAGSGLTGDKIYSIDHMIKNLNNKINGKLNSTANVLHNCQSALADIYNGSNGYNMQYSGTNSSNSSSGSTSNSTTGSLTPYQSENQSMLSSLLEGCQTNQLNGLQPKLTANKLSILNSHNLLASSKSDLSLPTTTTTNTNSGGPQFTNSSNSNLNLIHSLSYSLVNAADSTTNPFTNLTNSFKPLNHSAYNLSNLSQFSQLNSLQPNSNGASLFAHHSDLLNLSNYGSMLTNF